MPAGRPREYDREAILTAFEKYVTETDIPIIAEFAAQQGFGKHVLHDFEEFSNLLKKCTAKKEGALEREALAGKVNCSMAIFSLKQLGWTDRQETTHRGAQPVQLMPNDLKPDA